MSQSPKILVIRLSSLGDILHVAPAFSSLRAAFPDGSIHWLVAKKAEFLVRSLRGIDAVHVLDTDALVRSPLEKSAWIKLWDAIRQLRAERFDIAIDFQGLLKTAIIGLLSGAKQRIGFAKEIVRERPSHWFYKSTLKKPANPVHVLELNQKLASLAGAKPAYRPLDFYISEEDLRFIESILSKAHIRNYVVINPGGGWLTKCWAPEKYGELARRIRAKHGIPVVATTGPGEDGLYERIAQASGIPAPLHLPVSFMQLVPLFKKAQLFIGGDTGPYHLACAVGTPTIGIFGPTSPIRNGPWTKQDAVLHHPLDCSNCYGRSCPTGNECMDITVDEVFAAVTQSLDSRGDAPIAEH